LNYLLEQPLRDGMFFGNEVISDVYIEADSDTLFIDTEKAFENF